MHLIWTCWGHSWHCGRSLAEWDTLMGGCPHLWLIGEGINPSVTYRWRYQPSIVEREPNATSLSQAVFIANFSTTKCLQLSLQALLQPSDDQRLLSICLLHATAATSCVPSCIFCLSSGWLQLHLHLQVTTLARITSIDVFVQSSEFVLVKELAQSCSVLGYKRVSLQGQNGHSFDDAAAAAPALEMKVYETLWEYESKLK